MVISPVKVASAIEEFIRREFRVRGDDHNFYRAVHP
jgi:hypothetical protein